ncbi:hypothetical protein Aau02nite_60570 [Amorphoplanes auranticolor]|uniref:Transposase IS701-like DDE domain-containing protein n=1 Tax=Actinoplanes auranticolor TaxID=47988 RepID=A0A919SMW4_9ACTN|nr:hypothetical protein Aau02nite_60570 [Actinoplanes auranticolor]
MCRLELHEDDARLRRVDESGLARVREQLQDFAVGVFAGLPRVDQRETGVRYLCELTLDGQRKSMQPMAAHLGVGTIKATDQIIAGQRPNT